MKRQPSLPLAGLVLLAFALPAPAGAQSDSGHSDSARSDIGESNEELRQQLEAQKALNDQLRRRVQELEAELSGAPARPALQPVQQRATAVEPDDGAATAIEEALVAKGLVLLPPGAFRLTPGFAWSHAGASAVHTRSDTYTGSLTLQGGVPKGMMLSASVPYLQRRTVHGSNTGVGDFSLGLSKTLNDESDRKPAFIAGLMYRHDNGDDAFEPVPIGSGFRSVDLSLSAIKRVEPVALYGTVSYAHAFARDVNADNLLGEAHFTGRIDPGDSWGYRLGASLAATPDITFDASLSGAFSRATRVRSDTAGSYTLPRSTVAFFNLAAGFVLSERLSLLLSASAGVTDDSPDFIFSASLPYRF